MNEQFKELAVKAQLEHCVSHVRLQEFAELIVRECAKSANEWYQNHNEIHWDPATYILANFGVEDVSN